MNVRSRYHAAKWAAAGALIAALIKWLVIGGIGIAAFGGAVGLTGVVGAGVFAVLGAILGAWLCRRFGIGLDKKVINKVQPPDQRAA